MTFAPARPFTLSVRFLAHRVSLCLLAASVCLAVPGRGAIAQTLEMEVETEGTLEAEDPSDLRPLASANSILSMERARDAIETARDAASDEDYETAIAKLREARQIANELSNLYATLSASFEGIDNQISSVNRNLARDAAQLRDEATYELAVLHRSRNQPELAVPLLVEIINSQNPTRNLGSEAYRHLYELGFVDEQFPRADNL